MADLSPRNRIPLPAEFEEPYYQVAHDRDLAWDAAVFAEAENSQLQFTGGGIMGWDLANDLLFWGDAIGVTSFTTSFQATISGPASVTLQEGEVLYFRMPRAMKADTAVSLYRANRIFLEGTRLHDLRLFAARIDDVIYLYNGLSLKDGDTGVLFGAGLVAASIFPPHQHKDVLVIEPPSAGVAVLDVLDTAPDLARVHVYRNGQRISSPGDYSIDLVTGLITLVVPTVSASERFLIDKEIANPPATPTTHMHLTVLKIEPLPATALLDVLVTAPLLARIALYRNGARQAEPDDYSLDTATGFVTLVAPTVVGERFLVDREVNI